MRLLLLLGLAVWSLPAFSQIPFGALAQDDPVDVPEITALAMGDAVAAVTNPETAFFSNPAHLASLTGVRFTIVGAQVGLGGNFREAYDFYDMELGPAIEEGLDDLPDREQRDLYDRAVEIGRDQKTVGASVEAFALQFRAGPLAVGAGVFGHATARARALDLATGVPYLDAYSQADLVAPLTVALDVPGTPLSIGGTAAYVERRVTAKAEFVDALDADGEKLYLLGGNGVALSAGVTARDVALPGLSLGMALISLGGVGDLTFDRSWAVSGSENTPDDPAEIAQLERRFAQREGTPVLRMGAAYHLPFPKGSPIRDVALAADWVSGSTTEAEQAPELGFRFGAQATLLGVLELRGGLSQGYPAAGVGLNLRVLRLDYATFGVEDGEAFGEQERRNHVVQLRLGLL
ncbi:MAG: hypothetical protein AAF791_01925 [Bacteroidota bacterium]